MKRKNLSIKIIAWVFNFSKRKAAYFASSTAFFFFISMIPIMIFASAMLPYTGISESTFVEMVTRVTPNIVDKVVTLIIKDAYHMVHGVVSVSVLALLWAAGKGMMALIQGLNAIHDIDEHRNYFHLVFISILYTIVMLVSILSSMALLIFGNSLRSFIKFDFPGKEIVNVILSNSRFIWFVLFGTIFFAAIYSFLPAEKQKFKAQLPGAFFSAIAWTVFSVIFSIFMSSGSIYSTYYGSLASIIIFLLWLYGIFYILLVGAYINTCWADYKESSGE